MSRPASVPELHHRLLDALLRPAAAIAARFQVPLGELERLCRLAYYRELRRGGATAQAEVARIFGKSLRTVVDVERVFRTDFLTPSDAVERSRRLEEALTGGPLTLSELMRLLPESDGDDLERLLAALEAAGRVSVLWAGPERRFALHERFQSLVKDDLLARIDGLVHQLEVLSAAIRSRFYGNADARPSIARTLVFVGRDEDVEAMAKDVVRDLRVRAIDIEESALTDGVRERYGVTVALAPLDPPHGGGAAGAVLGARDDNGNV